MTNKEAVKNINVYIMSEFENIPKQVLDALVLAVNTLKENDTSRTVKDDNTKLYVVEEMNPGLGSSVYHLAVQAENEKEAERLGKEYLKEDSRVLFPKMLRMSAYESKCQEIITKDNIEQVISENKHKRK